MNTMSSTNEELIAWLVGEAEMAENDGLPRTAELFRESAQRIERLASERDSLLARIAQHHRVGDGV